MASREMISSDRLADLCDGRAGAQDWEVRLITAELLARRAARRTIREDSAPADERLWDVAVDASMMTVSLWNDAMAAHFDGVRIQREGLHVVRIDYEGKQIWPAVES